MRHNRWKKYLKIVCSWILIFSICCLSLNVAEASDTIVEMESESQETEDFISDIENQQTEPVIESEILADDEQLPESEQLLESEVQPSPEPEKIPETEDIIPECVEVELLKAEIQKDTTSETVPTTDRVEYIDENGNFKTDTNGNDVKPQQVELYSFRNNYFKDDMGYVTEPYMFYFEKGENTISLSSIPSFFLIFFLFSSSNLNFFNSIPFFTIINFLLLLNNDFPASSEQAKNTLAFLSIINFEKVLYISFIIEHLYSDLVLCECTILNLTFIFLATINGIALLK